MIPLARGRGYCTEAVTSLIHNLFDRGIERITVEAYQRNMPSLARAEKAIELNGVWLDGVVYELRR